MKIAQRVQAIRAAVAKLKVRHVVSPRATFGICDLLATEAFTDEECFEACLFKGMDPATKDKVMKEVA